jgi:hypothetical protein
MSKDPGTCFLCDGAATVGATPAPTGGTLAGTLVDCGACGRYFIPRATNIARLRALSSPQKGWIVGQIQKPYRVDDALIARAQDVQ